MVKWALITLAIFSMLPAAGQVKASLVVADSITRQPLAFSTIKSGNSSSGRTAVIAGINGRVVLDVENDSVSLLISHIGYKPRTIQLYVLPTDTVFLLPGSNVLGEVVVRSNSDKIRRIINATVERKPIHNPDLYEQYRCRIYYRMKVDMLPSERLLNDTSVKRTRSDSMSLFFTNKSHVLLTETYSDRIYRRPMQFQETVIASRISGLKKTWFSNLITDVLPFHVYSEYITLNGRDYTNPISKGWQQRYRFRLEDEIHSPTDTTYVLAFSPRPGAAFNSLTGVVYIQAGDWAITHIIASTGDSASTRSVNIEQVYTQIAGKWFPQELNYALIFHKYPEPDAGMQISGRSRIDSVSFENISRRDFRKAYPVVLSDSVDKRTEKDWQQYRPDTLTEKERTTYQFIDSIANKVNLDKYIYSMGRFATGKLPVGKFDIELSRVVAFNDYERARVGAGLYSNDRMSKYFSAGGWFGYGLKDKRLKYGYDLTMYPSANKDHWLRLGFQDNYQSPGAVRIHKELDRSGFRNWILQQVDRIREYSAEAQARLGYWNVGAAAMHQRLQSRYDNNFTVDGKNIRDYEMHEGAVSIRYAFSEKRVPLFETYINQPTRFPVFYLRLSGGQIKAEGYNTDFFKALAAMQFRKHLKGWGNTHLRIEAGFIKTKNAVPLPRSSLLAGAGYRTAGTLNYYAWGGMITMDPNSYHYNRYAGILYKQDLDWQLWKLSFSRPFISLAHNLQYGGLSAAEKSANQGISDARRGYHETGVILNQLFQVNVAEFSYLYINGGAFYHWHGTPDFSRNGVIVVGITAGF